MPKRVAGGIRNDRLRDLYRLALKQGFEAVVDGRGHVQMVNPTTGDKFVISTTAGGGSMGHAFENTRANARRAGLKV